MNANWTIRKAGTGETRTGLSTDDVRTAVFRGEVDGEDWACNTSQTEWRQIALIDEFADGVSGSRRRKVRTTTDDAEMDMTPMIDVTFLLLIFFMITASFSLQKGLDVPSNSEQESEATAPLPGLGDFADRLLVEINDQNEFSLKDPSQPNAPGTPIPAGELFERINQSSQAEGKRKLLILAHEKASHQAVVMAIDAAGRAGITDVSLADFQVPQSSGPASPGRIIRSN